MTSHIPIIQLSAQNSSMKNIIVNILSNEWPLSAKLIHNKLRSVYGFDTTYQATHNTLTKMTDDAILEKIGKSYCINKSWINNLSEFASDLGTKYNNICGKYEINPNFDSPVKLHFDSFTALTRTLTDILTKKTLVGNGPNTGAGVFNHLLWPLRFRFIDFEALRRMSASFESTYIIARQNSLFDKWLKDQYLLAGFTDVKLGLDFDISDDDIIVNGDSIIKIKMSPETGKFMDTLYSQSSNLSDIFKSYTAKKHDVISSIDVTITKNPELADVLRRKILACFK